MRALAAVQGPGAARTRFLGFRIRSAGAQPIRGGRVRRSGLTVANSFANSRKCLTEQFFPLHWRSVVGPGIIRPEPNTPHWVHRTGFSQTLVASAQR